MSEILNRKYILLGLLFIVYFNLGAQISEGGFPPSFYYDQSLRSRKVTDVPVDFYVEDLRETDNWRAREGAPMPVAKLIAVDYSLDNSGEWTTLPAGERVWQLRLKAGDAVAVMLYYRHFYIPRGGKLFIYSPDRSQLLGAYTNMTNPEGGLFATEFIGGQELVLEYVAATESEDVPRIEISEIGYGYNASALKAFCAIHLRAGAASCEVNVNCTEGEAWQNEKRGICHTIQRIGSVSYICSASLLNNTAEDFKPLILTARHCAYDGARPASVNDMNQWLFYFHYEREGCENTTPAIPVKSMTGCSLVARTGTDGQSDGMLLLLNQAIPEDYGVYYNGWDRRDVVPNSGVGLHHPEGDYMKISTYGTPATITTFQSSEFTGGTNAHLNVTFMLTANGHGITEAGSSGSPLFNENKLVVGTLTGGNSSCQYTRGLNLYGRFYSHWDRYNTDSISQMSPLLDPLHTGATTLAGRYRSEIKPPPTRLQAVNQGQAIYLSWNAPDVPVEYYNIYRNNQKIDHTSDLYYTDNDPVDGLNTYSITAVYPEDEESAFVTTSITFIRYKAPTDLQALRTSSTRIKISWNAPVYEQTIHWGGLDMGAQIGFEDKRPFYYGQKWLSSDLSALHSNLVKAVQFIPVEGNSYQIYIKQGERVSRQDVDNSALGYGDLNRVNLVEPFVIDASQDLIVAIYISSVGSDYPAACDNGPAVNGKGDIYSENGTAWDNLYDENRPTDFNYNFIVGAVISSEKRDISPAQSSTTTRSSAPVLFPQVTRYRLYMFGSPYVTLDGTETTYIVSTSNNHYTYEVSAIYGDVESPRSNRVGITTVAVDNVNDSIEILPSAFSNNVHVKGYEYSTRVEVISAAGKICMRLNNAGPLIDTSALTPGVYFFRIYGDNNRILKTVKTVKVN
jgi:hypothetical protein